MKYMISMLVVWCTVIGINLIAYGESETMLTVVVQEATWVTGGWLKDLQPKEDSGKTLLLLKAEIENKGKEAVLLTEEADIKLSVSGKQPEEKIEYYMAKGICINQAWQFVGIPKEIELQTKEGWLSFVNLDSESIYGSHLFLGVGGYRLTIKPGGKIALPILIDVPRTFDLLELFIKGATPVKVTPKDKKE